MLRIARPEGSIWQESVVDGPGIRLTLFLSGCNHACPGCQNAWLCDPQAGDVVHQDDILRKLLELYLPSWHDGITISGGDPFYQSIELAALLSRIRRALPGISIWAYSGYLYEELHGEPALSYCDVLVDGPFIAARANEGQAYRGSGNQRIVHLFHGQAVGWE